MTTKHMAILTISLVIVFLFMRLKLHVHLRKGLPNALFNTGLMLRRILSGLSDRRAQVQDHELAFLEGGSGETVVLLHDFGGEKDNWLPIAAKLRRKRYAVLIPDIAGFGESDPSPNCHYDIVAQVRRLRALNQKLNLKGFHLLGCGMGGAMAGIYASLFPKEVLTLAMIEPFGIDSPHKSEVEGLTERGWSPLTVKDERELGRLLGILFTKKPSLSGGQRRHLLEQGKRYKEAHDRIWKEMWKNRPYLLESVLPQIKVRTLVLSGDSNKIFHQTALRPLAQGLPDATNVMLKKCGHWPMMERPGETFAAYLKFLKAGRG